MRWWWWTLLPLAACGTLTSADDPDAGAGPTPSDGGAPPIDGGISEAGCGNDGGGAMVALAFGDAGAYCVDATEVTNEQYGAFVEAGVPFVNQRTECAWNTNWAPNCANPTTRPSQPVVCIDWCDAFAYCRWLGKRLCGRMGTSGANNAFGDLADPARSEWFSACSAGGTRTYAYGKTAVQGACPSDNADVSNVASNPKCIGGFDGLSEMSGNVGEWEASCNAELGRDDTCRIRGGDKYDKFGDQTCAQDHSRTRGERNESTGFRCCADVR